MIFFCNCSFVLLTRKSKNKDKWLKRESGSLGILIWTSPINQTAFWWWLANSQWQTALLLVDERKSAWSDPYFGQLKHIADQISSTSRLFQFVLDMLIFLGFVFIYFYYYSTTTFLSRIIHFIKMWPHMLLVFFLQLFNIYIFWQHIHSCLLPSPICCPWQPLFTKCD